MRADDSVIGGRSIGGKDGSGQNGGDGGLELHRNGYELIDVTGSLVGDQKAASDKLVCVCVVVLESCSLQ